MATNLAPHNLGEVIDGICAQIDNPEITLPELMQHIKGPDFPVACEIRGIRGIEEYFRTGRGSMRLRGKMEIEENARRQVDHHHPRGALRREPRGARRNASPNSSTRRSSPASPACAIYPPRTPASRSS